MALHGPSGLPDPLLLLGALPEGVYTLDGEGRALYANPSVTRILGWAPADLLGRSTHGIIHHSHSDGRAYDPADCPVHACLRDGLPRRGLPETYWRKDGTKVSVELDCHPIVGDGGVGGVLAIFRDVTAEHERAERMGQLVRSELARARAQAEHAEIAAMMAQAPALMLVTRGRQHVVDWVNVRFREAAGPGPRVGAPLDESTALPPDRRALLDAAFEHGTPAELSAVPHVIVEPVEAERRFDVVVQPLRDGAGTIYGVVVHASDVTAQVHARDALLARNRMATLMARVGMELTRGGSLRDMLQACAASLVEYLDAAFARIWRHDGAAHELVLEASAGLYIHLDGAHARVPVGRYKIGQIAQERRPHLTNDVVNDPRVGDREWAAREGLVSFAGYPLMLGEELVGVMAMFARRPLAEVDLQALGVIAHVVSIGIQRKRHEDALVASEAALRRRAADLARTARALERSNRELDAFAYAASHDLRAPLRGIANLSHWIEEDLQASLTEEARGMLSLMRSRTSRMEGLVEGLLQYSRAGRVRQPAVPVDTDALVREVVDLLAPPDSVTVAIGPALPTLVTERLPLQQVFLNLIGNAIKHAGRTDVRVDVSVRIADGVPVFSVSDDGAGIAPEYHERIWGIFQTLEARDKVEGTGIGLSLVKKIVESHGGQVGLVSAPGAGATFSFSWPDRPAGDTGAQAGNGGAGDQR
jgi:PAS domain S-box-containing protein